MLTWEDVLEFATDDKQPKRERRRLLALLVHYFPHMTATLQPYLQATLLGNDAL